MNKTQMGESMKLDWDTICLHQIFSAPKRAYMTCGSPVRAVKYEACKKEVPGPEMRLWPKNLLDFLAVPRYNVENIQRKGEVPHSGE